MPSIMIIGNKMYSKGKKIRDLIFKTQGSQGPKGPTDIYSTFHPIATEYTLCSSVHGNFLG